MIFFGRIEFGSRRHFGYHRRGICSRAVQFFYFCQGLFLLFRREPENGRPVLGADVRSLAVERGWVVVGKKNVQQLVVGDHFVVKDDFDRFGVAGAAGTDLPVVRVFRLSAGVADGSGHNSRHGVEHRLNSPEAAGGENGLRYAHFFLPFDLFFFEYKYESKVFQSGNVFSSRSAPESSQNHRRGILRRRFLFVNP